MTVTILIKLLYPAPTGVWRSRNDEMFDNPIRIRDNKAPLLFTKSSIISRIIYYIFIHTICRWEIGPTKMKNNNSNRLTSPIMDRNIDTYYTDGSKMIINYTPINSYAVVNGHGKVVNYGLTHAMQNDSFLGELAAIAVCLIFHTNKKELYIVSDSESAIKLLTGNTPANWKGDLAASRIIRTIKNAITKNSIPKITLLHINSHKTGSIHNVLNNLADYYATAAIKECKVITPKFQEYYKLKVNPLYNNPFEYGGKIHNNASYKDKLPREDVNNIKRTLEKKILIKLWNSLTLIHQKRLGKWMKNQIFN